MVLATLILIYLIIGLILVITAYMRENLSLIQIMMLLFLWPLLLIIGRSNAKKIEDCGC